MMKLNQIAVFNSSNLSKKDNFSSVLYLDTGSITDGKIKELQELTFGVDKIPSRAKRKVKNLSIVYSTVRPNQRHFGIIIDPETNLIVSTGFAVIDVDPEKANPIYVYYYLTQPSIISELQSIAEQSVSTYPSIRPDDLADLELDLPSIDEQNRIADALFELDEKFKCNAALIKSLRNTMQSVFNDKLMKEECGGKSEWQKTKTKLKDVLCLNSRGLSPKYRDTGIPVINQRCIRNGVIIDEAIQYAVDKQYGDAVIYKEYDVLINSMGVGTLGRISQVGKLPRKYLIHSCITVLRSNETILKQPVLGCIMFNFRSELEDLGNGTTGQTSLDNDELGLFEIVVPPMEIQTKYNVYFKNTLDLISCLLEENTKLISMKNKLLSEYFDGEED